MDGTQCDTTNQLDSSEPELTLMEDDYSCIMSIDMPCQNFEQNKPQKLPIKQNMDEAVAGETGTSASNELDFSQFDAENGFQFNEEIQLPRYDGHGADDDDEEINFE